MVTKLIFDTSAINAVADDPECDAIVRSLPFAYHVGITETAISEVAANSEEFRRLKLLKLLERLLKFGMCLNPFQVIIDNQAKAYLRDRTGYDWPAVNVRFQKAEEEVVRQEIVHSVSDETREAMRQWEKDFKAIFSNAKPAFQKLFETGDGQRPSLAEVTGKLLANGGAHLAIGADLFERGTGTCLSEPDIRDFIERCLPFKALLVALCFSQYDRCIRDERYESLGKAGRLDMFSAVYLAYCRVFVTNDQGQSRALKTVAQLIGRETQVLMYADFKAKLFGLSAVAL